MRNLLFLTLLLTLPACTMVKPWERAYLADPIMTDEDYSEIDAFDMHMHRALSQGLIGSSTKGGGCGCEQ